ncbi:MAG TPA: DUF4158 domain-containing protein [Nonomuraea sp.]|nr:DUF4158 domain-containing protein [Nonomuraea sp.]
MARPRGTGGTSDRRRRSSWRTCSSIDDADKKLIKARHGAHNRLGYAVQLTTVRHLGRFLADPLDGMPTKVIDCLAEQLGIEDASCLKKYAQRADPSRARGADPEGPPVA